jgi:uncharacterized protein YgbK (DUF1537 family)
LDPLLAQTSQQLLLLAAAAAGEAQLLVGLMPGLGYHLMAEWFQHDQMMVDPGKKNPIPIPTSSQTRRQ